MFVVKVICLLLLQIIFVEMYTFTHQKPVAELEWQGKCTRHPLALNDCNWCRCNKQHQYVCDARVCAFVDKFGHFNDAIRDIDVGMEGKGSWRSSEPACEPAVQYRRGSLLCVCTSDGTWPNPVCRDVFRVLHSIEVTGDSVVVGQTCQHRKLYLVGCNTCFCPSSGQLDPKLCTKRECSDDDPVLKYRTKQEDKKSEEDPLEIYAECDTDQKYKLGCKTCNCLRNNRLYCGNCTKIEEDNPKTMCDQMEPEKIFSKGCNLCYCDKRGFTYCTTKQCLPDSVSFFSKELKKTGKISKKRFDQENCIPNRTYKVGCNDCFCYLDNNVKVFGCTLKNCAKTSKPEELLHLDCVKGTFYELNCLLCQCHKINGVKTQLCRVNPVCTSNDAVKQVRSNHLNSLHGYCEPYHEYKEDCNTCSCLADGKTVRCSSFICKSSAGPISVDVVPVAQKGSPCPKGLSYRIDCNYCFCLPNGNAICTTADCNHIDKEDRN